MIRTILIAGTAFALLGACVPSPLETGVRRDAPGAEVPRDARGEPVLSAVRPMPGIAASPTTAKPPRRHRSGHWFGLF